MDNSRALDEAQIRGMIEDRANELRAKNVGGFMAHYAPEIVKFDLPPPLRSAGADALEQEGLEVWFSSFQGPIGYEIRDLCITAGDDLAFCHGLIRISGARTDGSQTDVWARETVGLRKIAGAWKITHEHTSVPFYMDGSFKAAVDLKP
jgi:ketosteroid isomerase-like protein